VDYLLPIYREANTYPHLLEEGIEGNPDRLSGQELHDRAWALVGPRFDRKQKQAADQYRQLAGTGRTASELEQVVTAAHRGEVETLFVALGRHRWGRFDAEAGRVEEHEPPQPGDEDLLNCAAVHAQRHGGTAGDDPQGPFVFDHHQDAVDVGVDHLLSQFPDGGGGRDHDQVRRHVVADFIVGGGVDVDQLPPGCD
jgi:hypothetical protein